MGCVARTARRRRKQAAMGYRHVAKKQRPGYRIWSTEASANRLRRVIETERRMKQKKR